MLIALANGSQFFSQETIAELKELGHEVRFGKTAGEVLAAFSEPEATRPALLVVDNFLCHGDEIGEAESNGMHETGVALYRLLRKSNPTLPILIYTTAKMHLDRLRKINDPNFAYILEDGLGSTQQIIEMVQKLVVALEAKVRTASTPAK